MAAHGTATAPDRSCASAAFQSIQSAVTAVAAGGTAVVCGGTYHEDVAVSKPLSLTGEKHAVIDAAGLDNGILVTASYAECQPAGGVPGDCGEGIHLLGSSWSTVAGNVVTGNTGGILLTDETGPAAHNKIIGNVTANNLYDCGSTLAGHNPGAAPGGVPSPQTSGVYANLIEGNSSSGNGTGLTTMGTGAGVLIATALPGGTVDPLTIDVAGNVISGDHFGIWTTGPVTVQHAAGNVFLNVAVHVAAG